MHDALALAKRAQSLDPLRHNINDNLGKVYLLLGDDENALHHLTVGGEQGMNGDMHWVMLGLAFKRLGDIDGVRITAENAVESMELPGSYVQMMVDLADNTTGARHMSPSELDELPPLLRFDICIRANQFDCARQSFLSRMQETSNTPAFSLLWLEEARPLRQQTGFEAWLESWANWPALMAYWTTDGWPEACPKSINSLDCS